MNLALYIAVVWMAGFAAPSTNITTGLISKGVLPVLFIPPTLQALGGLISRPNPTLRRQTRELMSQ